MNRTVFEQRTDLFYDGELPPDYLFDDIWIEEQPPLEYPVLSEETILVDNKYKELSSETTYLSEAEERDCIEQIQIGKNAARKLESEHDEAERNTLLIEVDKGKKARDTLVLANLRYAGWLVRESMDFNKKSREKTGKISYRGRIKRDFYQLSGGELDYDERLQIVTEALIKAADNYTGLNKKGEPITFQSWALWRMEAALIREMSVRSGQSPISMGPGAVQKLHEYRKAKQELELHSPDKVTISRLAQKLDISPARVLERQERDIASQSISYEVIREYMDKKFAEEVEVFETEDDPLALSDVLVDAGTDLSVEDEALDEVVGESIDKMLGRLNSREQRIIDLHFGFEDGNSWTLEEIGREFSVSKERIRQIKAVVLKKLRSRIIDSSINRDLWNLADVKREWMMDLIGGSQAGSLRPILALDEADDIRLGIERAQPYSTQEYHGIRSTDVDFAVQRRRYALRDFDQMRRSE